METTRTVAKPTETSAAAAVASKRSRAPVGQTGGPDDHSEIEPRNEVLLWGRLSAPAEQRDLPSGDVIVTMRVVVRRPPPRRRSPVAPAGSGRAPGVDTIDVVCWSAAARRSALRFEAGTQIEVAGSLRRRFFGGTAGRQSRYEVEAASVRRRGPKATSARAASG